MTRGVGRAALLIAVVTAGARVAGFGRTVVFSQTVGDTCLGAAYITANQLPAVLFEIVIGGALTAVVVPVMAAAAERGEQDRVERTASALFTWVLLLSVPLAGLIALSAPYAMALMLGGGAGCDPRVLAALSVRMLLVFAPQVVFYGLAAVLYGVLQSHRRFLSPAAAPLVSSAVVICSYLVFVPLGGAYRDDPAGLPSGAELVLSAGTTAGVAALFLTVLGPAARLGLRWRPRLAFPPGAGRRVRSLAVASLVPLAAMQVCLLLSVALANRGGGVGGAVLYSYAWALFMLPYGVIAVPIATSAFTALAVAYADRDQGVYAELVAGAARACVVLTGAVGTALAAAAAPVAAVFSRYDPVALERALAAYAPGVVGFGLVALFSRALYASHNGRSAAVAQTLGWLLVMGCSVVSVAVVPAGWAIAALGWSTTLGLTCAASGCAVSVWRMHGAAALAGAGRSVVAVMMGGGLGWAVGRPAAAAAAGGGVWSSAGAALAAGGLALAVFALVAASVDRPSARVALERVQSMFEGRRGNR